MNAVLSSNLDTIILTADQQAALEQFNAFVSDPAAQVFVIEGYSGTGKSTLVKYLLDQLPSYIKTLKLIMPSFKELEIRLTATTNKAAEALSLLSGMDVCTIHSFLGLRVHTDHRTNTSTLVPKDNDQQEGYLLFIDEASYIGSKLLTLIFKGIKNCKIVFMGDPAQLLEMKSSIAPVFAAGFPTAKLTEPKRAAADSPITALATEFRHTVNTGIWPNFQPDGKVIKVVDRDTFNQLVLDEFTRPDWRFSDSKLLAWTNKRVVEYNHYINSNVKGDPAFQVGDYAINNSFISIGKRSLKTDQLVCITGVGSEEEQYDVVGKFLTVDYTMRVFMPNSLQAKKARIKEARDREDFRAVQHMEDNWIDLRSAFACTVNKSQGSTYDYAYIDLDDISRCNSGDTIARMMYVGTSRARYGVIFTGDLA